MNDQFEICPRLRAPARRGKIGRDTELVFSRLMLRRSNPFRQNVSFQTKIKFKKVSGSM